MTKEELKEYLVDEAEYSTREVESMSSIELVDTWLEYNGIIGFTADILEVIEAAFKTRLI